MCDKAFDITNVQRKSLHQVAVFQGNVTTHTKREKSDTFHLFFLAITTVATSYVVLILQAEISKVDKQNCGSDVSPNWIDRRFNNRKK